VADEIDRLTTRIEDVNETIDTASKQENRVEALRKRKELQAELNELRSELDNLTTKIDNGFPEKRQEIGERHSLTVRLRPVATTAISYERGDLDLTLESDETTISKSYGYALGSGVVDEITCDSCNQAITAENPIKIDSQKIVGTDCCNN